jgi:hypothetical protein
VASPLCVVRDGRATAHPGDLTTKFNKLFVSQNGWLVKLEDRSGVVDSLQPTGYNDPSPAGLVLSAK